jgi:hypothetical protein
MIVTIAAADLGQLAKLAKVEAQRHEPRTPERRAASHLFVSLTVPTAKSAASARTAIASFGADHVQAEANALLHRLAAQLANTEGATQ